MSGVLMKIPKTSFKGARVVGWADEYGVSHYVLPEPSAEAPMPDIARVHEIAARILEQAEDELDLVKQQQMITLANVWVDLANSMIEASRV